MYCKLEDGFYIWPWKQSDELKLSLVIRTRRRGDGWMELRMRIFVNDTGEYRDVEARMMGD